jgi:hypothetical protein
MILSGVTFRHRTRGNLRHVHDSFDTLFKVGGWPPTTLEQFIQENREAFE